jgi:hypothetical protein
MSDCWFACNDDAMCRYECSVTGDQCIDSCPCFSDCPDGCVDCFNSICAQCSNPDEDPDYLICSNLAEILYLECIVRCSSGDAECLSNCARDYTIMIEQCPCQVLHFNQFILHYSSVWLPEWLPM